MSDALMTGLVTVKQGDVVIIDNAKNHFTNYGMETLLCDLNISYLSVISHVICTCFGSYSWSMYLGTNTTVGTTPTMTALNSPIGTTPGTVPTTANESFISGATNGTWATVWSAMWTQGSISGTVGEMALYLCYNTTGTANGAAYVSGSSDTFANSTAGMYSRLSVADGDFNAFAINTTQPLTVDWKIQIAYS